MNTAPRVEGRTDEPSPVDAWFDQTRSEIADEAIRIEIERAEAIDRGDKAEVVRLYYAQAVVEAREEHLVELGFMCDPTIDPSHVANRLGNHLSKLSAVLTSQNETAVALGKEASSKGHVILGGEEAKVRARMADTSALIHVIHP